MIPGGVPSRIGPLLGSLPIHPSSVSGRYYLCVLFFLNPTPLASRVRYGKRYGAGYYPEIAKGTKDAARLHSPRITGRVSRARTEYEAPPLSSPCLSPKAFFWRVTEVMVGQEV